jgi:hypothetical protein
LPRMGPPVNSKHRNQFNHFIGPRGPLTQNL